MMFTINVAGAILAGSCGFYCDVILRDRNRAAYHIAWMGVFLACLALFGKS